MPDHRIKFSDSWLDEVDSNGDKVSTWCRKGEDGFSGYCIFCKAELKCDNSGKSQLFKHSSSKRHKDSMRHMKDKTQAKLMPFSVPKSGSSSKEPKDISVFVIGDAALDAEIYWLVKAAQSNYSLRSIDHIGELFKKMFPDSKVVENFKLS